MLDAIADVGRDAIGQEVRGAHAAEDQERERRVDFTHAKGGAAGSAGEFHVRNEPTQREEVVPADRRQPGEVRPHRIDVPRGERLEPNLERAVDQPATSRAERQDRDPHAPVQDLEPGLIRVTGDVVLAAATALHREHVGAPAEGLARVVAEGAFGARRNHGEERNDDGSSPCHGGDTVARVPVKPGTAIWSHVSPSLTWGATRGARCAPRSAGTGAVSSSFEGTTPLEGACRAPAHDDDYHPTENYRPRRLGVLIPQPCVSTRAI